MKKIWNTIKDYVYILLAVVLIRSFLITPALVEGDSMDNTLKDGELVIVNKITYTLGNINRFDIVVIDNKQDNDKIIKRIIGMPNEKIEYKDDKLYINDSQIIPDELKFEYTDDFIVYTKENEYFVLGDNRDISKDSRMLGNFKKEDLIGKVNLRLYPFNQIGIVK